MKNSEKIRFQMQKSQLNSLHTKKHTQTQKKIVSRKLLPEKKIVLPPPPLQKHNGSSSSYLYPHDNEQDWVRPNICRTFVRRMHSLKKTTQCLLCSQQTQGRKLALHGIRPGCMYKGLECLVKFKLTLDRNPQGLKRVFNSHIFSFVDIQYSHYHIWKMNNKRINQSHRLINAAQFRARRQFAFCLNVRML